MAYDDIIGSDEAGDLIPEKERDEILKGLPAASAALSLGRQVSMSTRTEKQPVLSALPNAYWVNGDTGLKQTTKAMWDNKTLRAEELAVLVPIPDSIAADSKIDLFAEIKPLLIEAIGAKVDEAVIWGEDTPYDDEGLVAGAIQAGNIVVPGSIEDENGNNDLALDIGGIDANSGDLGLMGLVEDDGFGVTGFAASTRLKSRLRGLRDQNGGLLFQPSLQAGTPDTLYGEPLKYVDGNGAWDQDVADIIGGDWTKLICAIRQDLTFKVFEEGVISDDEGKVLLNLMQQDSKVLRVVFRLAFAVANPINRKSQVEEDRYPFAVLGDGGS